MNKASISMLLLRQQVADVVSQPLSSSHPHFTAAGTSRSSQSETQYNMRLLSLPAWPWTNCQGHSDKLACPGLTSKWSPWIF